LLPRSHPLVLQLVFLHPHRRHFFLTLLCHPHACLFLCHKLSLPLTVSDWLPLRDSCPKLETINSKLLVQRRTAPLAHAILVVAFFLVADSHRTARGADQHHVRDMDLALLFGNTALDVALWIGAHVFLYHAHMLHQQLAFLGEDAQHAAAFFIVFAAPGNHLHHVVLSNIDSCTHCQFSLPVASSSVNIPPRY